MSTRRQTPAKKKLLVVKINTELELNFEELDSIREVLENNRGYGSAEVYDVFVKESE